MRSKKEKENQEKLLKSFLNSPLPKEELVNNLFLYIKIQQLTDLLSNNYLYKLILNKTGYIFELGCRWGQRLSQFISLRGIYEPYNFNRRIIGFDTFEGFPNISCLDGNYHRMYKGSYNVTKDYEVYLDEVLTLIEAENPISHIKKFDIVKGDINYTLKDYLSNNPEVIVSLIYFDLDLYEPTKNSIELLKEHIHKGTILAFDQLSHPNFPGETIALKEILDINRLDIKKVPFSHVAYIKI